MIKILVDGVEKTLSYIDQATGSDMIWDLLGNNDAFGHGNIEGNSEDGYTTTQENHEWWLVVIDKLIALDERTTKLTEDYGSQAIESVVQSVGSLDLEDHADAVFAALDEAFGEDN